MSTTAQKGPNRPPWRNFAKIHERPLPVVTYPLPAFYPHNPLSLLSVAFTILIQSIFPPSSHQQIFKAYFDLLTQSIHVTDPTDIRGLWEQGFFGKGSLSRSEPEWLERQKRKMAGGQQPGGTSADVTNKRREERRQAKRERARVERETIEKQLRDEGKMPLANGSAPEDSSVTPAMHPDAVAEGTAVDPAAIDEVVSHEIPKKEANGFATSSANTSVAKHSKKKDNSDLNPTLNQEHLQLTAVETFFLAYGLGVLTVLEHGSEKPIPIPSLFRLLRENSYFPPSKAIRPDDPFLLSYIVYHHFRSLGWVVRSGIKFSCDYLLYARGPAFTHAEFAVLIMPSYSDEYWKKTEQERNETQRRERKDWWWLHCVNRVEGQVKKTLVLAYVDIPPPEGSEDQDHQDIGNFLKRYRVKEFIFRRWSANRNRD